MRAIAHLAHLARMAAASPCRRRCPGRVPDRPVTIVALPRRRRDANVRVPTSSDTLGAGGHRQQAGAAG